MKIALVRLDERLIHGQVMTAWVSYCGAKEIIVIDDEVYADEFTREILMLSVLGGIKIDILSVEKFKEKFESPKDDTPVLILYKTPKYVLNTIKAGIKLDELMVGNMGSGKDRERVSNTVYMSPAEKKIFEEISDTGCNVYLRMMPKEPAVPFKEIQ